MSNKLSVECRTKQECRIKILASKHGYEIFTTYNSLPREPNASWNGKHRILVDIKKMNALKSDDKINSNLPISPFADAGQLLAEKIFCKLECSQAYNGLQLTDQR